MSPSPYSAASTSRARIITTQSDTNGGGPSESSTDARALGVTATGAGFVDDAVP